MNMLVSASAIAVASPTGALAATDDPIFSLIEAHREAFRAYLRAINEECEKEETIKERSPSPLVAWRNYSAIGGSEIEDRRDLFLSRGLDPATIEREYQEVRARYEFAVKNEREFQERHELAPLIDAREAAYERANEAALALINVKPTTMHGILALLDYVSDFDVGGVVMKENNAWYSDHENWPQTLAEPELVDRRGKSLELPFHSWLIRNVHDAMMQIFPPARA